MADYVFRYRLSAAPSSRTDGSGCVDHEIWAIAREAGTSDPWTIVPGRHKTVSVPGAELAAVMDMPHSTGAQKSAKNTAYKQALADNINTQPVAVTGWTAAALQGLMDGNDLSAYEAGRADDYITVTLGQSYPVDFSI